MDTPEGAFLFEQPANDDTGLMCLASVIDDAVGGHPEVLLNHGSHESEATTHVDIKMQGYASPEDGYIQKVVENVGALAVSVYPERFIIMLSDFTRNGYEGHFGGDQHEPDEEYSMIGFRGDDCYTNPFYDGYLAAELEAIKKVEIMTPLGRTLNIDTDVDKVLEMTGLKRGGGRFNVNVMVELPGGGPSYGSHDAGYVQKMVDSVGTFAASVYPECVIVSLSGFKRCSHKDRIGGDRHESDDKNPMVNFRDGDHYTDPFFDECLAPELGAVKKVRGEMGLTTVEIMIPFVRTLGVAKDANRALEKNVLKRGEDGLKVRMMVELPSNDFPIHEFLAHFGGFALGHNDLVQLIPGLEGDSGLVEQHFDERRAGKARGNETRQGPGHSAHVRGRGCAGQRRR